MILRINPATASLDDIAATVVRAEREAGIRHAFVDPLDLAKDVDQALGTVRGVLERARENRAGEGEYRSHSFSHLGRLMLAGL